MTLYTKKKGEFIPMTRQQIRKLRRVEEVVRVQKASAKLVLTSRALAAWLASVQRKGLRLDAVDMVVTRLPNVERLQALCDDAADANDQLRRV